MAKVVDLTIRSDRPQAGPYTVRLVDGVAVACSCVHGRSGRKGVCYHKRRAELAPAFLRARAAYLAAGHFGGSVETFNAYFKVVSTEIGVDAAIERVIANAPAATAAPKAECTAKAHKADCECPRCGGEGYIPRFAHVEGGICFRCR